MNGKTFAENPDEYRKQFTYIPETPILYDELTLEEHLRLTAMAYGLEESVFKDRMGKLLKEFRYGKTFILVSSPFFKRNAAKGDDYVCVPCSTTPCILWMNHLLD